MRINTNWRSDPILKLTTILFVNKSFSFWTRAFGCILIMSASFADIWTSAIWIKFVPWVTRIKTDASSLNSNKVWNLKIINYLTCIGRRFRAPKLSWTIIVDFSEGLTPHSNLSQVFKWYLSKYLLPTFVRVYRQKAILKFLPSRQFGNLTFGPSLVIKKAKPKLDLVFALFPDSDKIHGYFITWRIFNLRFCVSGEPGIQSTQNFLEHEDHTYSYKMLKISSQYLVWVVDNK